MLVGYALRGSWERWFSGLFQPEVFFQVPHECRWSGLNRGCSIRLPIELFAFVSSKDTASLRAIDLFIGFGYIYSIHPEWRPSGRPATELLSESGSLKPDAVPEMMGLERQKNMTRENSSPDSNSTPQTEDVYADFKAEVDRILPKLVETRWFAMSYMMIPKLIRDADDLIARMESADAGRDQENLLALLEKLKYLRLKFARIVGKQ